jgi:hypothetical protein
MGDELAALGAMQVGGEQDLDAELVLCRKNSSPQNNWN